MTLDELFEHLTNIIASPHTAITKNDRRRAVRVLLVVEEYMSENYPDEHGNYYKGEFLDYADKFLKSEEWKNE
jgi:hypothetical protein